MKNILSIDPGRQKCGLLLADITNMVVISGKVVKHSSVIDLVNLWKEKNSFELVLLGNGTSSSYWKSQLVSNKISSIKLVDETSSTLRARDRYWELCPPGVLFRWFPKTMIFPPENLDAVVGLILLEDYLGTKLHWPKPIEFKTWP